MWSDVYQYFQIRSDANLSNSTETKKVREFLEALGTFIKKDEFTFINQPSLPFLNIIFLFASAPDSWSSLDVDKKKTNLIIITCSKGKSKDHQNYIDLFRKIAKFLNWEFIKE